MYIIHIVTKITCVFHKTLNHRTSVETCSKQTPGVNDVIHTVRKKMEAVHFTTIPCEPNAAKRHKESHIFGEIRPCTNNIVDARFEVVRTFLWVFMSVCWLFVRY